MKKRVTKRTARKSERIVMFKEGQTVRYFPEGLFGSVVAGPFVIKDDVYYVVDTNEGMLPVVKSALRPIQISDLTFTTGTCNYKWDISIDGEDRTVMSKFSKGDMVYCEPTGDELEILAGPEWYLSHPFYWARSYEGFHIIQEKYLKPFTNDTPPDSQPER